MVLYPLNLSLIQAQDYLTDSNDRIHVEHSGMMSSSALVRCSRGSKIWIQSQSDECFVYGDDITKVSTFGGYLVKGTASPYRS